MPSHLHPLFVCMMKGCILQTLSCSSGSHQDISQFPSVLQGESFQFSELVITAPLLPGAFSVDKCRRSNSSDLTHAAREDSSGNLSSSSILPQFEKYTINIPTRPGQPLGKKVHYKLGGFVMKRNIFSRKMKIFSSQGWQLRPWPGNSVAVLCVSWTLVGLWPKMAE